MYRDDHRPTASHPSWCRCTRCDLFDREQERRALAGHRERPDLELSAPPASASTCDPEHYITRREGWERLTEQNEVHRGAFA